jgi:hypothetical protein
MSEENITSIQDRILFNPNEEWNLVISNNMDGAGGHYITQNKPDTER